MKSKPDIRDISHDQLVKYLESINEKTFRASQIFDWIYKKGVTRFDQMTNLSVDLRDHLKNHFSFGRLNIIQEDVSKDETRKVLFDLGDHQKVETVLIPTKKRSTVCISTQAGCKFGCRFCASGVDGWVRNLNCWEIMAQVLYAKQMSKTKDLSHIVFMGTGEPLDNYDELLKAIRLINSDEGMNIAARRITVSTCGLVRKIEKLAKEGLQIELAISLHGSDDPSRNVLMPINKKYPVKELIQTCRKYIKLTNRQITFEYILIKDITCTEKNARQLGKLLKGMICKMNLIPYNPVNEFDHQTPSRNEMYAFKDLLEKHKIHATIRMPRGRDVNAACGQLRLRNRV